MLRPTWLWRQCLHSKPEKNKWRYSTHHLQEVGQLGGDHSWAGENLDWDQYPSTCRAALHRHAFQKQSCPNVRRSDLWDKEATSPTEANLFEPSIYPGSCLTPESCSDTAWAVFLLRCFSLGDFTFRLLISSLLLNQHLDSFQNKKKHVKEDFQIKILPSWLFCHKHQGCYPAEFRGIVSLLILAAVFSCKSSQISLVLYQLAGKIVRQKALQTDGSTIKGIFLYYGQNCDPLKYFIF